MGKVISGGTARSPQIQKFYPDYFQNQELSGSIGPPKNGSSGGQGGSVDTKKEKESKRELKPWAKKAKHVIQTLTQGNDSQIIGLFTGDRKNSDGWKKKVN